MRDAEFQRSPGPRALPGFVLKVSPALTRGRSQPSKGNWARRELAGDQRLIGQWLKDSKPQSACIRPLGLLLANCVTLGG